MEGAGLAVPLTTTNPSFIQDVKFGDCFCKTILDVSISIYVK